MMTLSPPPPRGRPLQGHAAVAAILLGTENVGRRRGRRAGLRRGKPVGRYRLVNSWSRAEWERLPIESRPEGAIPFGDGWVLLAEEPPTGSSRTRAKPSESVPAGESRAEETHP